ncbi:MAG: glycosyltransferase [Bacteroidota bacterium]
MNASSISILLPVRNAVPFLSECLASIRAQSIEDWELLAIDDHSTDDSPAILQAAARDDSRIRVFANQGRGIIEALRLAYRKSSGQFITRMDADDWMPSNKLAVLRQQLLHTGPGHLATGLVSYFSDADTGLGDGYKKYQDWLNALTLEGRNFEDRYRECVIPSPCWMLYRSDLDKAGAFASNIYPEDYDLCFRFYQAGLKVIPCDTLLHHWRDSPGRSSRTDPHYADNRFLDLKLHYFLHLDRVEHQPLVLWGAGKKGKWLARQLMDSKKHFHWICNNPSKIGKDIYGQRLYGPDRLSSLSQPQLIIAVAGQEAQAQIKASLQIQGCDQLQAVFFFC